MKVIWIITIIILVLGFINQVEPKTIKSSQAIVQTTIARDEINRIGER